MGLSADEWQKAPRILRRRLLERDAAFEKEAFYDGTGNNNQDIVNTNEREDGFVIDLDQIFEEDSSQNEIDCTKFENMDNLPDYCRDHVNYNGPEVIHSPPAQPGYDLPQPTLAPSMSWSTSTVTPTAFSNLVTVSFSVGVVGGPTTQNSQLDLTTRRGRAMTRLVTEVLSTLLDRYTPLEVRMSGTQPLQRALDRRSDSRSRGRNKSSSSTSKGQQDSKVDVRSHGDFKASGKSRDENNGAEVIPLDEEEMVARLDFHQVQVRPASGIFEKDWTTLAVDYAAYWPNNKPVTKHISLQDIEIASFKVLNLTIAASRFWQELQLQDKGGEHVLDSDIGWYTADSSIQEMIAGVALVGEEYNLEETLRARDSSHGISQLKNITGYRFNEPIEFKWGTREWFGVGLCLLTIFLATLLAVASFWWNEGSLGSTGDVGLTEAGVGELLQIGWRYHHQNHQVFMQVFYKGSGEGYNEDNSILEGGFAVPQDPLAPPPHFPSPPESNTETMSTPFSSPARNV